MPELLGGAKVAQGGIEGSGVKEVLGVIRLAENGEVFFGKRWLLPLRGEAGQLEIGVGMGGEPLEETVKVKRGLSRVSTGQRVVPGVVEQRRGRGGHCESAPID